MFQHPEVEYVADAYPRFKRGSVREEMRKRSRVQATRGIVFDDVLGVYQPERTERKCQARLRYDYRSGNLSSYRLF